MSIGSELRDARNAAGLTIAEVAERSGFSISYISQLERDLVNPSVGALTRIADAVGVRMRTFFCSEEDEALNSDKIPPLNNRPFTGLVRRDRRKSFLYPGSNILHELLCPDLRHTMEILKTTAPVGTDSGDSALSHEGEECAIVLRGKMEFHLSEETYVLEAGDALYFDSIQPHSWTNIGTEELEVLWVITPPYF